MRENKVRESTPAEFFQSLPEELQVAAKYVADGGQDLKGLFRVLSHVEETFELNPEEPSHQERIVREYLTATNFGSPEEIQEEVAKSEDNSPHRSIVSLTTERNEEDGGSDYRNNPVNEVREEVAVFL